VSASAYDALILAKPSLSLYLKGEGPDAATAFDDAGPNGLDGTAAASGITYDVDGGLDGPNTAVAFDGSSDPATAPDNAALDLGDGPLWFSFWFERSATQGANQMVVTKGTGAWGARFDTANRLVLVSGANLAIARTTAITDQDWHWAYFDKDGAASHVYLDGVDATNAVANQTLTDTATTLRIGFVTPGVQRFPGSLARLAVGKGAVLSPAEITELWEAARPPAVDESHAGVVAMRRRIAAEERRRREEEALLLALAASL
jgi:hypothetical protein